MVFKYIYNSDSNVLCRKIKGELVMILNLIKEPRTLFLSMHYCIPLHSAC